MSSASNGTGERPDLFNALAHPLREQIRNGRFAAGALLPSESELARAAGTKRYSIRKALLLLQNEGLIEPVAGRGWAVVDQAVGRSGLLPRYRQIAEELRDGTVTGLLAPGSALPSETELMAAYGVSRATVRRALVVLESDGLISTYPGKGRYVRHR
ncbi:regulatory GntR family protein [Pseudonocardia hierapolitana]|uniref:Regulatory GntR family protein n=1 Tax=Pseudonocardia hierapolitana TaxID=1128676 RepID=A0A561SYY1_9PSEU|nr:GntR family transcriptional regulator [Pseudonocardia hierapolitana]TWF80041.1 regulatory GntR family protein [Pseudonocardia hierapolitana]